MVEVDHGKYLANTKSRGSIRRTAISAFVVLAIIVSIYIRFSSLSIFFTERKTATLAPGHPASKSSSSLSLTIPTKLESGWDDTGRKLYSESVATLSGIGFKNVTILNKHGPIFVSNQECNNRDFWGRASSGGWEPRTFRIFDKYVTGETTVIDFGTWIGPTLLYHGQFSKHSFGIEADPVAYAVAEYNVDLNRKLNPEWGKHVSIDSACVSRPEDAGFLTMKAGGRPGASMSGINGKVAQDRGENSVSWQVKCYTLPDIFDFWGLEKPYKDVFIKIDIESYECKLIPSFYDWLKDEIFLPKMFINYHPSIRNCSDEEWKGLMKFLKLYDHVRIGTDSKDLALKKETTFGDFMKMAGKRDFIVYQNQHAEALKLLV